MTEENKYINAEQDNVVPEEEKKEETASEQTGEKYDIDLTEAESSIPDYVKTATPVYDFEVDGRKHRTKARKRGFGCLGSTVYLAVIIVLSIVLASFVLTVANDITGLVKDDVEITVEIPDGANLTEIAAVLKENGLINNELGLLVFARLFESSRTYQTGTFTLNPRMGYQEMLKALSQVTTVKETVNVTFVEGKTIEEIAAILESNGVCSATEFLKAVEENDYSEDYSFVADIPENEDRIYKLEGYIFPDTYQFYKASDADTVVKAFLKNFDNRFSEELREEAKKQGMTVEEVVNLASIVQKEGASKKTMQMVAAVFHNRLDKPSSYPYLQSNATLSYSLGEPLIWMDEEDMQNPDPYNSYNHKGLPPSAICNPGLDAIKAVLYPDDNDYYYFVTDSNSKFYFSKTSSQHEKQVANIKKNGVGIGEGVS